jgi:hypothetical protein
MQQQMKGTVLICIRLVPEKPDMIGGGDNVMWTISRIFSDSSTGQCPATYNDLEAATIAAIEIADEAGKSTNLVNDNKIVMVKVHSAGRCELSITVIKGGLLPAHDR